MPPDHASDKTSDDQLDLDATFAGGERHPGAHPRPQPEPRPAPQHLPRPEPVARGRWQAAAIERSADAALSAMPVPLSVLDVGCGDGALLREMVVRIPYCEAYVGVEAAPGIIVEARQTSDLRISFVSARPEALPFPDARFDLVVSSLSFDRWPDQRRGVSEMARVVSDTGTVVLVDTAAAWMSGKGRARSPKAVTELLTGAGLQVTRVETLVRKAGLPFVRAFVAFP